MVKQGLHRNLALEISSQSEVGVRRIQVHCPRRKDLVPEREV